MSTGTAISATARMPPAFARTGLPGRIIFGDGALGRLAGELDQHDLRNAMFIAADYDAGLAEQGRDALGDRVRLSWPEVRQHVPRELAERATAAATAAGADVLVAIGGGSTTGLGKAVAVSTGLPLTVVPTTYAGSEMTPIYGLTSGNDKKTTRDPRALPAVVVYDPRLLVTLPPAVVGPSGMNALAHCAEALYVRGRTDAGDMRALEGAELIALSLPQVVAAPRDVAARTRLLRGACFAGEALALAGLGLAHAMAQTLGGIYGLPHGAMNAVTLPPALRFNAELAPDAVARFGVAIGAEYNPAAYVEKLARLGNFKRLRDYGVRETDLPGIALSTTQRPGNEMNPRAATPAEIEELLRSIY
jgi:maleylacetate reductase